jgi:thiaminase (transcriptional activator TenA)
MTYMTSERFTDQLRSLADPIWAAQHAHPFVRGIGDGTLDVARFSYFIRQDYLFLIDYARLLALGAARAPDLVTMRRFAELAQAILVDEMDLHRGYAAEFGISAADLEAEPTAPTTQGYTDFLVRTASHGDFAELATALLPCMWGYAEVGQRLAQHGRPAQPRYAKWIDMYADEGFAAFAAWCRELVDRLGADAPTIVRNSMTRAFITSSRYELAFWQAAWDRAGWPA